MRKFAISGKSDIGKIYPICGFLSFPRRNAYRKDDYIVNSRDLKEPLLPHSHFPPVMFKTIFVINIIIYACLQHSNVL